MSGTMPPFASISVQVTSGERSHPAWPAGVGMGSSSTHAELCGAARPDRAPSASAASTTRRPDVLRTSDADEQTVTEVGLEVRPEDLLRRGLHVVLDAPELEQTLVGVVDDVAGAWVVVTRLA